MPKKKRSKIISLQKGKSTRTLRRAKQKQDKQIKHVSRIQSNSQHIVNIEDDPLDALYWLMGAAHWFSEENEYFIRTACKEWMPHLLPTYKKPKARKDKTEDETIDGMTIGQLTEHLFGKLKKNGHGNLVRKGGQLPSVSDTLFELVWEFVTLRNEFTHHFHETHRGDISDPNGQSLMLKECDHYVFEVVMPLKYHWLALLCHYVEFEGTPEDLDGNSKEIRTVITEYLPLVQRNFGLP